VDVACSRSAAAAKVDVPTSVERHPFGTRLQFDEIYEMYELW
jgi:hypothetical protein